MPVQPVSQNFNLDQAAPTASKSAILRPGDTLSQAANSSTLSDGFIMSMLKPVGRFFANLYSYFKYLICCCADKSFESAKLPQLEAKQFQEWLGQDYKVEKKSDFLFEVTKTRLQSEGSVTMTSKKITFTVELVPYEGSFALKIEGGDDLWESEFIYKVFSGSSAVMVKDTGIANDNGYNIVVGECRVKKGAIDNLIVTNRNDCDIRELVFVNGAEIKGITLADENSNYIWTVFGIEKNVALIPQIVEWAQSEMASSNAHEMLVVRDAGALADSRIRAKFYSPDGVNFFKVIQDKDGGADARLFKVQIDKTHYQLAWTTDEEIVYMEVSKTSDGIWTIAGLGEAPDALEKLTAWAHKHLPNKHTLRFEVTGDSAGLVLPLIRRGFKEQQYSSLLDTSTMYDLTCKAPDKDSSSDSSSSSD